jgi:hypothetical protein
MENSPRRGSPGDAELLRRVGRAFEGRVQAGKNVLVQRGQSVG